MNFTGMDIIAIIAGLTFLVALGFLVYFRLQERHKKGH